MLTCAPDLAMRVMSALSQELVLMSCRSGPSIPSPFQQFDVSSAAGMNRDRNFEATRGRPNLCARLRARLGGWPRCQMD